LYVVLLGTIGDRQCKSNIIGSYCIHAGFPPRRPGFKLGSAHVGFFNGQKWRRGNLSPRTSVSLANLHCICFSTIIFTITRGWHNRPGMAAVTVSTESFDYSQSYITQNYIIVYVLHVLIKEYNDITFIASVRTWCL
jgi:hypothetical protein